MSHILYSCYISMNTVVHVSIVINEVKTGFSTVCSNTVVVDVGIGIYNQTHKLTHIL